MRSTLTCPRCQGRKIWHVHPLREQGSHGRLEAVGAGERDHVHFDAFVCDGCGLTAWYTVAGELIEGRAEGRGCVECGGVREVALGTLTEHVRIRGHNATQPIGAVGDTGELHAIACAGCGRVRWELARTQLVAAWADVDAACGRCGGQEAMALEPVEERAPDFSPRFRQPLPVAFRPVLFIQQRLGWYALQVCRACRDAQWFAHDRERLRVDPRNGVRLLEGAATPAGEGPYR